MKDHNPNPQTCAERSERTAGQEALTVPIVGKLTSQTTPEDFRRFARLASASAAATISAAPDGRPVEAASESLPMTLRAYQRKAAETAGAGGNSGERRIMIAALELNGLAVEVADLIEKKFGHGHDISDARLADELGDVLWYLAELATALNLDLATIAQENCEKLRARYPDGFSAERSRNRLR